jgi:CubicO group peptidase (beta-lactamase class C family)
MDWHYALVLVSFLLFQPQGEAARMPQNSLIDSIVAEQVQRESAICTLGDCNQVKDVVVGIVDEAGPKIRAYHEGKVDAEMQDRRFVIGSISKTFVGTIISEMAHENKIDLDAPAANYLPRVSPKIPAPVPSFDGPGGHQEITIRHLLTHTAGLPYQPDEITDDDIVAQTKIRNHYSKAELFRSFRMLKLSRAPGTKFQYSSFGFAVLTAVIETADKKPFAESLRERILQPLGMKNTGLQSKLSTLAPPYTATGRVIPPARQMYRHENYFDGAGGIESTAADLLRYAAAQLGLSTYGKVPKKLSDAMMASQEMQYLKRNATNPGEGMHGIVPVLFKSVANFLKLDRAGYVGMDWFGNVEMNRVGHSGVVVGYKSSLTLDHKQKPVGVIVLTNSDFDGSDAIDGRISWQVANAYVYCAVGDDDESAPKPQKGQPPCR